MAPMLTRLSISGNIEKLTNKTKIMKQSNDDKQNLTNDDMTVLSDLLLNIRGLHPASVQQPVSFDDNDGAIEYS